jgi:predicted transcriptional regulator
MAQWSTQQRAEYLKQCWELKLGGHSGVDIAAQLGISHQSVSELLNEARQAIKVGAAASALEERKEATERLDTLLKSVWTQAKEGDLKAVSTVLSIEERRAKLNGTDAPVKTATDLTSGGEPLQFTVTIPRVMRVDEGE